MDKPEFVDRLAFHWGELAALHPGLDGNTRTRRYMVDRIAQDASFAVDWRAVNADIERFKHAGFAAHAGQTEPLRQFFTEVVRPGRAAAERDGAVLAGPAVDPAVHRAAMEGLAEPVPGRPTSGATSLAPNRRPEGPGLGRDSDERD